MHRFDSSNPFRVDFHTILPLLIGKNSIVDPHHFLNKTLQSTSPKLLTLLNDLLNGYAPSFIPRRFVCFDAWRLKPVNHIKHICQFQWRKFNINGIKIAVAFEWFEWLDTLMMINFSFEMVMEIKLRWLKLICIFFFSSQSNLIYELMHNEHPKDTIWVNKSTLWPMTMSHRLKEHNIHTSALNMIRYSSY